MKHLLIALAVVALSVPSLWAEHYRFSRFYGPGSFVSYRSHGAHRFHRLTPYGSPYYGTRSYYGSGFYARGYYGARAYPSGYLGGFAGGYYGGYYGPGGYLGDYYDRRGYDSYPVYPSRYYSNYETRGTYAVYLGPSNPATVVRANYSDLIFNVSPDTASVYVDGSLIGSARSFATHRNRFPIIEGTHQLRIEHIGHRVFETTLQVVPDHNLHIDVTLEPNP